MIKFYISIIILFISVSWLYGSQPLMIGNTVVGASTCPPFVADTNVTFSWNGEHSSGTKYGCKTDRTTILGSGALVPNTSYGESGSFGVSLDGANAIVWATSGDAQIDNETGTVWLRIKTDDESETITMFEGAVNGVLSDSFAFVKEGVDPDVVGRWELDGTPITAFGNALPTGSWVDVAYSWDRSNGEHSCWGLDGTGWEEDADEIAGSTLDDFDEIVMGEDNYDQSAPSTYLYIDRIVILSTYEASKPANW